MCSSDLVLASRVGAELVERWRTCSGGVGAVRLECFEDSKPTGDGDGGGRTSTTGLLALSVSGFFLPVCWLDHGQRISLAVFREKFLKFFTNTHHIEFYNTYMKY